MSSSRFCGSFAYSIVQVRTACGRSMAPVVNSYKQWTMEQQHDNVNVSLECKIVYQGSQHSKNRRQPWCQPRRRIAGMCSIACRSEKRGTRLCACTDGYLPCSANEPCMLLIGTSCCLRSQGLIKHTARVFMAPELVHPFLTS